MIGMNILKVWCFPKQVF